MKTKRRDLSVKVLSLSGILIALSGTTPSFAMGGVYGKADPTLSPKSSALITDTSPLLTKNLASLATNPEWPVGVTELVTRPDRVGGFWVNASDWFDFTGNTADFNDFLQQYAALHDTPLTLVLHPGKAPAIGLTGQPTGVFSEWRVSVLNQAWTPEEMKNWTKMNPVAPNGFPLHTNYTVTVDLWLGGQVDLAGVKVPANVQVKAGGESQDFVAQHQAK